MKKLKTKTLKNYFLFLCCFLALFQLSQAQEKRKITLLSGEVDVAQPYTDVLDVPTSAITDYGGFATRTRFFSGGGLLTYLTFGVFQRLNLGASLNFDRLIGNSSPVTITRPEIQVKFRFYDGDRYLPSLAVGYDGQGLFYDRGLKKYMERSRGLFVVGSLEMGLPGFFLHPEFNISDFDTDDIFGAVGATWTIEDKISLMAEYDNIRRIDSGRFNAGLRIHVTPFFNIDFAVREIGKGNTFANGASQKAERIVQLKYTGNF
ncbi:MAG: hypothetical protein HY399_07850 [Elusimicrobia bacterium]|nr:hypothetical protein [Elusimicrobiota bacterium]